MVSAGGLLVMPALEVLVPPSSPSDGTAATQKACGEQKDNVQNVRSAVPAILGFKRRACIDALYC